MAKNRNKKRKNESGAMAVDSNCDDYLDVNVPQAMDTSETGTSAPSSAGALRKMIKGRPMKRSKNVRRKQAVAKAISRMEKSEVKLSKDESKKSRTVSAKTLYD